MRRRRATVATPGEWQCKIRQGGVRRLGVANGPNIFQMLFVSYVLFLLHLHCCTDCMDYRPGVSAVCSLPVPQ